jgi:hypothetical protein
MAGQGNPMHEGQIRTVVSLLASTEMSIPEIAQRMGCSRSAIAAVNRKFQVRQYQGRRSTWVVAVSDSDERRVSS